MPSICYILAILLNLGHFLSAERKIFVNQSQNEYNCFSKRSCDGSEANPFGSIFEAINEGIASPENVSIKFSNSEYTIRNKEFDIFKAIYAKNSPNFIFGNENNGTLSLEGAGTGLKSSLVFENIYFSFELGKKTLILRNLDFKFNLSNLAPSDFIQYYVFKFDIQPFESILLLKNVTIVLESANLQISNLSMFLIVGTKVSLEFEDCYFWLEKRSLFTNLFLANGYPPHQVESYRRISFAGCKFLALNPIYFYDINDSQVKSYFEFVSFHMNNSIFENYDFWWHLVFNRSILLFKDVQIKIRPKPYFQSTNGGNLFLKFTNSIVRLFNIVVLGANSFLCQPSIDEIDKILVLLDNRNTLFINNMSISNSYFQKVFSVGSENLIEIMSFYVVENCGTIFFVDSDNKAMFEAGSFSGNIGKLIALNQNNSISLLSFSFGETECLDGSPVDLIFGNQYIRIKCCNFYDNYGANAGAVDFRVENKFLIISNCTFLNNFARGYSYNLGGALSFGFANSIGIITNSKFFNNFATSGGAISLNDNNTNFLISASVFRKNSASRYGGAICFLNANWYFFISNCTFELNKVELEGSAVAVGSSNFYFSISRSDFKENKAQKGTLIIKDNNYNWLASYLRFENNTAIEGGIAISIAVDNKYWCILHSTFENQWGGRTFDRLGGSGILIENGNKFWVISNSNFKYNKADLGKVILINQSNFYWLLSLLTLHMNSVGSKLDEEGVVKIATQNLYWIIFSSNFTSHSKLLKGGALFIKEGNCYWLIMNCYFQNNEAQAGGALYIETKNNFWMISNSTFLENKASYGGAYLINNSNSFWKISYSRIELNSAMEGGAHYLWKNNSFWEINLSFFKSNWASKGGIFYLFAVNSNFCLCNSFMENNTAENGGAIFLNENNTGMKILNVKFQKIIALTNGGALYANRLNFDYQIISSVFVDVRAGREGGVTLFYKSNRNFLFSNCSFFLNSAFQGAGFYNYEFTHGLIIEISKFFLMKSDFGSVLISDFNLKLTFIKCAFFDIEYTSSIFRIGQEDSITIEFCNFKNLYPLFPGTPVFHLVTSNNKFDMRNSQFERISDYIFNDFSNLCNFLISYSVFEFDSSYKQNELFSFGSNEISIAFISNKILANNLEEPKIIFLLTNKISDFTLEGLFYDSLEFIRIIISLVNPLRSFVFLNKISIRNYSQVLLKLSSNFKSLFNFRTLDSIFTLNCTQFHFIEIKSNFNISIKKSKILISNFNSKSVLYLLGYTNKSTILIDKTEVRSISTPKAFSEFENFDSPFGLIQALVKVDVVLIQQTTISIGTKNLKSIIDIYIFNEMKIISSFICRNFLNRLSSLIIFGLCNTCRFFLQGTKIEDNRVAHGSFVNFHHRLGELDVNTIDRIIFYLGSNNTIRKNSASLGGGHLFFNASLNPSLNFTSEFVHLLDKFFYIEQSTVFDHTRIFTFFVQTSADNLINMRNNFNYFNDFLRLKFNGTVLVRSAVTSYKLFSQNKRFSVNNSLVSLSEEIVNNKSISNIYHFCITLADVLGRDILFGFETDLYPSLYNNTALEYLSIQTINIHFKFIRGAYCAHKFLLQGDDYATWMGKKLTFSISPKVMKKVVPDLIEDKNAISYQIAFLVHDCNPGELYKENQCVPCPRNSFLNEKVIGTLNKCKDCTDFDYYFCYGGNMLAPKANFWRVSSDSEIFLRCPSSSCLGDPYFQKNFTENDCIDCFLPGSNKGLLFYSFDKNVHAIGFCKHSYKGNLCSECIEGFGSGNNYKCSECSGFKQYLKQAIVALINIILFYYSCWDSIKNNTSSNNHLNRNSKEFVNNTLSSNLLSILFIYLNVIGVLKNIPFDIGDLAEDVINFFYEMGPSESLEFFSFKCLLNKTGSNVPPVFFQILMNFVFFGFSIFVLLIMFFVQIKQIPNRKSLEYIPHIKGIFLIFLMNNLIRLLAPSFRVLLCVNLGDARPINNVLLADLALECDGFLQRIFRYFVSIPLILVYGLIIPALLMYKLFKSKHLSNNKEFLLVYGYFTSPFKREAFYFEVFHILHKLILINFKELFIFLIMTNNQPAAPGLLLCYLLLKYNLFKVLSPYDQTNYLKLQNMHLLSLKTNISNSMAAFLWTLLEKQLNSRYTRLLLLIYVVVTNSVFLFIWGQTFIRTKKEYMLKNDTIKGLFMKVPGLLKFSKVPKIEKESIKIYNNKFSKKTLIKENNRLKILIGLLVQQIEYVNENLLFSDGIDEGKTNYLVENNRYFDKKKVNCSELQSVNTETSQNFTIPKIRSLNKTIMKKTNLKPKHTVSTSQELIMKKLKGSQFHDFFLQIKYRLLDNLIVDSKEEINLTENLPVTTHVVNKNWIATVSSKNHKKNIFYLNLRRFSPWINRPHSEILKIEFKIHSYKTEVVAEINLQDFIKINTLEWQEGKINKKLVAEFNNCEAIEEKLIHKLFKKDWKNSLFIEGALELTTPFTETTQKLIVVIKKDGAMKIFGKFFAKDKSILYGLVTNYLELQEL